jgi:hypothetical protein
MSLEITFRPQKDLYVNNPPDAYDEAYYNSRWVAGHLPIQYKISNTKYPENLDDDSDSFCTVTDVNGFAEINLCGTYETYVKYEYIKIEGSSVDSYNGVWQILEVVNGTTYIISAAYDGVATGTFQRYYNNYHNLVKVYAGIPAYHQYTSEDPMSLIATLKIEPNTENLSIADISGLIQAKLNCDNDREQISEPNDLNAWTGFYIEYAESYDVSDGSEVSQFTSSYTTDLVDDCNASQLIVNGNFPTNLNGWTNGYIASYGTSSDFVWDSGVASATKGSNGWTKTIYQENDFISGVNYNLQLTAINNESNFANIIVYLYTDSTLSSGVVIWFQQFTGTQSININFTPSQDYGVIGFNFFMAGTSAQKVSLDNISVQATDEDNQACIYFGYAINGTRQFQNVIGGNFGDYVQNFNDEVYLNKFLTHFENPIWFNSLYFDLSTIIPKSTFDGTIDNTLYYLINEYTEGGGFIQRQDIELETKDDGVYRLPVSDLTLDEDTENFNIQIYQLPQNRLEDGNGGMFDYSSDPLGTAPSDWNIIADFMDLLSRSTNYAQAGDASLRMDFQTSFPGDTYDLWHTGTNISVNQNSFYIIEGYVLLPTGTDPLYDLELYLQPVGLFNTSTESYVYTQGDSLDTWRYIKSVFYTGSNTNITIKAAALTPDVENGLTVYIDTITVKGPAQNLSEIKNIKVDNSCTKQNIYLTWLNNLGAWEYFNFTAQKDYSVEIDESKKITRDIFNNWDTGFISGETQDDFIGIQAFEKKRVRSQFMTLEALQAVAKIKYAIRTQEIMEDDTKITVLVDKGSFKVHSDGDKLFSIEFDISYPNIQIQRQ